MTVIPGWTDGLPYALFRANQLIHPRLLAALASLDVTINQLGIAVHLDELGHLSGSDLARHLKITPQSAATALVRLESLGWVTRTPHPVNRRVIWYEVTDLGRAKAAEGKRLLAEFHAELEAELGSATITRALVALGKVSDTLDGPELPPGTMWPVK